MIPKNGQLVQIRFYNGIFFDAIVEEWSDQQSVLKLPDSEEIVIIQKTLQDVMLVKILAPKPPVVTKPVVGVVNPKGERLRPTDQLDIYEEFEQLKGELPSTRSIHRMAELKDEMNRLEREEMARKFNTFEPTGAREVEYGLPRALYVPSLTQHTEQEVTPADTQFDTGLQKLFDKKH